MLKKTATAIFTVLVFLSFAVLVNANVQVVETGKKVTCEDASWIIYNLDESQETNVEFDIGPHAYAWDKQYKRTLAPGGFQAGAIAMKTMVTNHGPGTISVNCQRKRYDSHDWKIDAGSSKTYQPNYHLDHVRPYTYIEPGMGQPLGTERGISGVTGEKSEVYR